MQSTKKSDLERFYDDGDLEIHLQNYRKCLEQARDERNEAQEYAKLIESRKLSGPGAYDIGTTSSINSFDGKENEPNNSSLLEADRKKYSSSSVAQNLKVLESRVTDCSASLSAIQSSSSVEKLVMNHLQHSPQVVGLSLGGAAVKPANSFPEVNSFVAALTNDLLVALQVPASRLRITDVDLQNSAVSLLILPDSCDSPYGIPTPAQLVARLAEQVADRSSLLMRGSVSAAITRVGIPPARASLHPSKISISEACAASASDGHDKAKSTVMTRSRQWPVLAWFVVATALLVTCLIVIEAVFKPDHESLVIRAGNSFAALLHSMPPPLILLGARWHQPENVLDSFSARFGHELSNRNATERSEVSDLLHETSPLDMESNSTEADSESVVAQTLVLQPATQLSVGRAGPGFGWATAAVMEEAVRASVTQCFGGSVPLGGRGTAVTAACSGAGLRVVREAMNALGRARAAARKEEEEALHLFRELRKEGSGWARATLAPASAGSSI